MARVVDCGLTYGTFVEHGQFDGDIRVEVRILDWVWKRLKLPFRLRAFPEETNLELQEKVHNHVKKPVDGYQNRKYNSERDSGFQESDVAVIDGRYVE